jgi:HSP20 family protein
LVGVGFETGLGVGACQAAAKNLIGRKARRRVISKVAQVGLTHLLRPADHKFDHSFLEPTTMNALTRFERLDDMFPEMFRRMMRPLATTAAGADGPVEIRVDVSEDDKAYEVRAEVPGAKKEDIHVTVDRNYVSISAEVKRESDDANGKEKKNGRTLVKELYYGSAARGFTLAHEVDEKTAQAKYDNGVLVLNLPKKMEASSRSLNIQ